MLKPDILLSLKWVLSPNIIMKFSAVLYILTSFSQFLSLALLPSQSEGLHWPLVSSKVDSLSWISWSIFLLCPSPWWQSFSNQTGIRDILNEHSGNLCWQLQNYETKILQTREHRAPLSSNYQKIIDLL